MANERVLWHYCSLSLSLSLGQLCVRVEWRCVCWLGQLMAERTSCLATARSVHCNSPLECMFFNELISRRTVYRPNLHHKTYDLCPFRLCHPAWGLLPGSTFRQMFNRTVGTCGQWPPCALVGLCSISQIRAQSAQLPLQCTLRPSTFFVLIVSVELRPPPSRNSPIGRSYHWASLMIPIKRATSARCRFSSFTIFETHSLAR